MKVRQLILLLILAGCESLRAAGGFSYKFIESTDQYMVIEARFDSISFIQKPKDGTWETAVRMPGATSLSAPGEYELPVVGLTVAVPPQCQPQLLILNESSNLKKVGPISRSGAPEEAAPERAEGWQPAVSAKIILDGFIRYQHVLQIALFPVRYQPQTQMAHIIRSLTLRIDFGPSAEMNTYRPAVDDGFEPVYQKLLANYETGKTWRKAPERTLSLQKATSGWEEKVKLYLKEDGIYAVTGRDLAEAGVDISSIPPQSLSMSNRGQPVPIIVEGKSDGSFDVDDRIIFLGFHNKGDESYLSYFSDTNVYQLSWGDKPGFAFAELLASPNGIETDTVTIARHKMHFEKDLRYERLVGYNDGSADHWFWAKIMDNDPYVAKVNLPGLTATSTVALTAKFHGLTESADVDMNHHAVAKVNGTQVGEGYGSDKKPFSLRTGRFTLDHAEAEMEIKFELPLDVPNVALDIAFLNWYEIDYDRQLIATKDKLEFYAEPGLERLLRAKGFKSDKVYILTENGYRLVNPIVSSLPDGYQLDFVYASSQPSRVFMASDRALKNVSKVELDSPSNLHDPANQADYIIIAHKDFMASAQRLADFREDKGLRTMVIDIQDVYDEFSDGLYDPRAIKRFLVYAFNNWQRPAPLYVLLFGDTTYLMDKDAAQDAEFRSFVPSFMVNTKTYGMTSSDNYFAAISGDDILPDVYLGRLPANTAEQADAMVDKIISYETKNVATEWRRHVTLAAGNGEFFDYSAQYLVDHYLPKWLQTKRLSTEFTSPHFNTTENFVTWINEGQNIIDFLVHGSGEQIADANLLNKDDIIRLNNKDKYAFAVTMSCYIGHFDNPEVEALGEALMVAKDKGVMGLFGSSGKSYSYSDFYFNSAVFNGIFQKGWRSLGEITTNAKYQLIEKTLGYWEPVENFLLLGDPASMLQLPREEIDLNLSKKVLAEGDVLTVSGKVPQQEPGSLTLSVLSESDSLLTEKQVELLTDNFNTNLLTMTADLRQKWGEEGGEGRVQAYFSNGQYHAVGLSSFSVIRPLVSSLELSPEKPVGFEPFYFVARIADDVAAEVGGIGSLTVRWTLDNRNWNDLPMQQQGDGLWKSTQPLSFEEGTTIWYKLVFNAGNGSVSEIESREFRVLYKPDVYWATTVAYSGGGQLTLVVKNRGESDAENVTCTVMNRTTGEKIAEELILPRVPARRDTIINLPLSELAAGSYELSLVLDPENKLPEEEENNNQLNLMLHVATPKQGSNGLFSYPYYHVSATVPRDALAHATSVELIEIDDNRYVKSASGALLEFLPLKGQALPRALQFQFADSTMQFLDSPTVSLEIDPSDSLISDYLALNGARIYAWDEEMNIWKGQNSTRTDNTISASLPAGTRTFALLGSRDSQPPVVDISIPGQNFANGDVVPKNPTFTIAIEDDGGLDVSPQDLQIAVDQMLLQPGDFLMAFDPQRAGELKITYNSGLESGDHTLDVAVRDVNGNAAAAQIEFSIAEEFGLDFIANHPNPFEHETTFAFQISDMATSVELNIYTVSGRLIRSFDFTDITGYNEVDWDGSDSEGQEIANGVYYLKFIARKGAEKIERIERIAKLK